MEYKLDYSYPFDSISTISAGAKINDSESNNNLSYFNVNKEDIIDQERSGQYLYKETVSAWYLSFASRFGKFNYKLGLRQEFTETKGINFNYSGIQDNFYNSFFPSFHIQYSINENNSIGLAYGKRIQRPNYWYLNPFKSYRSPFSFFEGNPFLRPAISNDLELSYSLNNKFFFTTFFQKADNRFAQLSIQDNDDKFFKYTVVNLKYDLLYGLSFSASFKIFSWWATYLNINTYYQESNFTNPSNNEFIKNKNWNFDSYFKNEIKLSSKHGLSLENINQFYSPKVQGGFDIKSRLNTSFGIKKNLFKNKASLTVYVEDVFNTSRFKLSSNYSNQNHSSIENKENQFIRFSFRYKFGSNKLKQSNIKDKAIDEKNRLE